MRSMTGFATRRGETPLSRGGPEAVWRWDLKSVNGRGFEARFRTPPGWDAWEPAWRARMAAVLVRGSVTAALTVATAAGPRGMSVNLAALDAAAEAAAAAERRLRRAGVASAPVSPAELLALKGVFGAGDAGDAAAGPPNQAEAPSDALAAAASAGLEDALSDLAAARAEEGGRLRATISERIDAIEALRARAAEAAERRTAAAGEKLRAKLAAVLEAAQGAGAAVDEARVAQELALLAVKADVSEELDRLAAHVAAARDLLAATAPVGRKFEFLTQELNREANTLCSKSQDQVLTEVGLELKVAIDQVREQAANVE